MSAERSDALLRLPLIAHVIYRFDYGGLENGVVNVINATQGQEFRHCVIALTEASDFRRRLHSDDVSVYEMKKKPGKDLATLFRFYRLVRRLKPAVLHTRNIGTIDCAVIGRLAGVPYRIHGEHGWDTYDLDGTNRKYRILRKIAKLFINQFVTVSNELKEWLMGSANVPTQRVMRICNGVDTDRFAPRVSAERHEALHPRFGKDAVIVGSVLRFEEVKDPMNLVKAFEIAYPRALQQGVQLRLVMIGDGALRASALQSLAASGLTDVAWLPGSRDDVAEIVRSMDLFVLGSRREGISNTLLEAMASGIPVVATDTGGNIELVHRGETGSLVEPGNSAALAEEILRYAESHETRLNAGAAARQRVLSLYSLSGMIEQYRDLYSRAVAAG
ncbi:MAG: TIGR03088 family PEP-CTERM/XrtA system glycosyltransferase [Pseudomonadota bacterium]